jgi:hypothetical protein
MATGHSLVIPFYRRRGLHTYLHGEALQYEGAEFSPRMVSCDKYHHSGLKDGEEGGMRRPVRGKAAGW